MKSLKDRLAAVCRRQRAPGGVNFADVLRERGRRLEAEREARKLRDLARDLARDNMEKKDDQG